MGIIPADKAGSTTYFIRPRQQTFGLKKRRKNFIKLHSFLFSIHQSNVVQFLIKQHAMKINRRVEVQLHVF
jgi:hypothetical protein